MGADVILLLEDDHAGARRPLDQSARGGEAHDAAAHDREVVSVRHGPSFYTGAALVRLGTAAVG
jgi:hypothetical protein